MGLRLRTIVLALVVIGLGVWIFGIDLPRERREIAQQEEAARLLPIAPADVDTLRVESGERAWTVVRREDAWWITRPIVERAETRAVQTMLERLARARSERVVVPRLDPDSWANYGLAAGSPGRVDLVLAGAEGERAEVAVGNRIVAGDFAYVRRPDSEALELVDQYVFELANASHHGMRRADLFQIAEGDVTRLDVVGPGGAWTAVRDTSTGLWYPRSVGTTPRYRRWVLDDVALAIAEQRVQAYLRDDLESGDWAAYGLDAPWASVTVVTKDGREQTLELGNERERGQFFARKRGLDTVLVVRPQFFPALDAGATGLDDLNPIPENLRRALAIRVTDDEGRWGEARPLKPDWLDWVLVTAEGEVESTTYRETAADNVARGLEEMQPERSLYLPSGDSPAALLEEILAEVSIRFDHATYELTFGWREQDPWFFIEGDASLYEVDRGMILRLHGFVDALYATPDDGAANGTDG